MVDRVNAYVRTIVEKHGMLPVIMGMLTEVKKLELYLFIQNKNSVSRSCTIAFRNIEKSVTFLP